MLVNESLSNWDAKRASFKMFMVGDPWLEEFKYPCANILPPAADVPVRLYSTAESTPAEIQAPPVIVVDCTILHA